MDWYQFNKIKKNEKKRTKKLFKLINNLTESYSTTEPVPNVLRYISPKFYTALKVLAQPDAKFDVRNTISYIIQGANLYDSLISSVYDPSQVLENDEVLAFSVSSRTGSVECFIIKVNGAPRVFYHFGSSTSKLKDCLEHIVMLFSVLGDGSPRITVTIFKMRTIDEIMRRPIVDIYDSDEDDEHVDLSSSNSESVDNIHLERL